MLNGNDDLSAIEFFLSLGSNSEIAESAAAIWAEKPGGRGWLRVRGAALSCSESAY
jgi:hypothetical protein